MSFVSPQPSIFASANIEGRGKQKSLFSVGPVIKSFVIPPNSKIEQIIYGDHLTTLFLPRFQGARPDHVRVESSSCCFHRELVRFGPWYVTRSPRIGKRI